MSVPDPSEIPPGRKAALDRFCSDVQRLAGSRALSMDAIGPALSSERAHHALDTVLVLSDDHLPTLLLLAQDGISSGRHGIAAPLVMTPPIIERSHDTFPLELLDISQRRVHLFGPDHFDRLELSSVDIRLQCERELRTVALAMRQRVLHVGRSTSRLMPQDLAESVVRVLRGMILIKNGSPRRHGMDVIAGAESVVGRTLSALRSAWSGSSGWDTYTGLYDEVRLLGDMVDGW